MKIQARLTAVATVALLGVVLAACGSSGSSASSSKDGGTIKIGVVLPYSGVQATIANLESLGVETAVKQINAAGGIGGKQKIELVKEDDQLNSTRAATVMRDLDSKGVKLALGGQTSDLCKAEAEAGNRFNILFIGAHCTSKQLINPPVTPNFYMTGQLDTDLTKANGAALAAQFPNVKSWDVFAYDQTVTRGFWDQTKAAIAATGSPVITNKEVYVPAAATDLKNQLSALSSSTTGEKATRGLFLGVYGAGTTSFIQQARPLGLLDNYAVITQTGVYWSTAVSLQGTAPPIYDVHEYFWSCQKNDMNTTFVNDFKSVANGQLPDTGAYQGYVAMQLLAAAIGKAGSSDVPAVEKAMDGISVKTPAGLPMTMNGTTHHADGPITTALLYGDKSAPETVGIKDCKTVQSSALK